MTTENYSINGELQKNPAALSHDYQVEEVTTKKQLKLFLTLPRKIYHNTTSLYVMPLELHVKSMMGKLGKGQKHFFLASQGGEVVARLGVKVHKTHKEERLHFGFFECDPKHSAATRVLFEKAHSLYPHLEMMGPFQFRQEDPYIGVLVEGFQLEPYFMMSYNHPEYDQILKTAGLEKAMDLFTYQMRKKNGPPETIVQNEEKAKKDLHVTYRSMNPKKLREEAFKVASIFNEALKDNWGFEEFLESQVNEMVMMFKFFIDPRIVVFAVHEGVEIGCLIMIPNYNHLIKPGKGRLDLGLIKRYLNRFKTTDSFRGYALGVLKKYHGKGIGSGLVMEMFRVCEPLLYEECEISWVLANNGPMNELSKAMGGKQNKVYRVYSKKPMQRSH
jgi:GNAT superfamily N-acetyltransferase